MDYAKYIIEKYNREAQERTDRALKPIRDDITLGESMPLAICDNCGNEHKCKVVPIGNGNAILCRSCFTKEMNFRRTNGSHYYMTKLERCLDTPAWYTLKWYNPK